VYHIIPRFRQYNSGGFVRYVGADVDFLIWGFGHHELEDFYWNIVRVSVGFHFCRVGARGKPVYEDFSLSLMGLWIWVLKAT